MYSEQNQKCTNGFLLLQNSINGQIHKIESMLNAQVASLATDCNDNEKAELNKKIKQAISVYVFGMKEGAENCYEKGVQILAKKYSQQKAELKYVNTIQELFEKHTKNLCKELFKKLNSIDNEQQISVSASSSASSENNKNAVNLEDGISQQVELYGAKVGYDEGKKFVEDFIKRYFEIGSNGEMFFQSK